MIDAWIPSPHRSSRQGHVPRAIVLHIMAGTLAGTDAWFVDPRSRVSTHYGIGKDGTVHQYVDVTEAAWGNGRVSPGAPWPMLADFPGVSPNLYTISIEHEGEADEPWTEPMMMASAKLVGTLSSVFRIPLARPFIAGHREIFTGKTCPGWIMDHVDDLLSVARAWVDQEAPAGEAVN